MESIDGIDGGKFAGHSSHISISRFRVVQANSRNWAWEDLYHNLFIHGSINIVVGNGSADYRIEMLESKVLMFPLRNLSFPA